MINLIKERGWKMKHYGDVNKINGAEVAPVDIITFGSPCQDLSVAGKRANTESYTRRIGGTPEMTKIHMAADGWQFAEVEFKSTISESEFCICDACHKTGEVMKLTLPETAYHRNGQLSTKYREYWLCPPCRRKLVHALDWPEE